MGKRRACTVIWFSQRTISLTYIYIFVDTRGRKARLFAIILATIDAQKILSTRKETNKYASIYRGLSSVCFVMQIIWIKSLNTDGGGGGGSEWHENALSSENQCPIVERMLSEHPSGL